MLATQLIHISTKIGIRQLHKPRMLLEHEGEKSFANPQGLSYTHTLSYVPALYMDLNFLYIDFDMTG